MIKQLALVLLVSSLWLGCSREPAIVVRFDPSDLQGVQPRARPDAAAIVVDASTPAAPVVAKPEEQKPVARCKRDAECVIVPDGCCDCANGGKQRVVARSEEGAVRTAQGATCKDTMCTMMMSTDPTCGKRAACVEGGCALRDARPDEVRKVGPRR